MGCIMKEMYMLMLLSKYFGHDCKLVLLMLMLTINLSSTDYKLVPAKEIQPPIGLTHPYGHKPARQFINRGFAQQMMANAYWWLTHAWD